MGEPARLAAVTHFPTRMRSGRRAREASKARTYVESLQSIDRRPEGKLYKLQSLREACKVLGTSVPKEEEAPLRQQMQGAPICHRRRNS
ncbi:hypothetical protein NDU88_009507 [Pleurodeles waltl]|uniref:Uncharacterized protein n=1 Tax=Pleurodeles waltl TaxID=8319 RepID=A0AAV7PSC0_PLEWA|nr:hypothetical protein NDU88_009507 [Pleurodeles waltl]